MTYLYVADTSHVVDVVDYVEKFVFTVFIRKVHVNLHLENWVGDIRED